MMSLFVVLAGALGQSWIANIDRSLLLAEIFEYLMAAELDGDN